ncbi:chitosanase [Desulfoplanes formicivorans]|uniref:Type VI secretion system spike protein VgrG3-like C-terminal domain-containing protein n=1 Tax=Desulfoplanes formicivorans TaxID=1592317 RepID=A0A194ALK9_9BACT|nr:chitosanase [Desulfoplanes formicivorans]GAU09911.1 hypothetical protein DPF_2647 [Desulfoplanes formicivorans]
MANALLDNGTPTEPGTDLLSQTLNLEVLATLSKLSGHQDNPVTSLMSPHQTAPGKVRQESRNPEPELDHARAKVDKLAREKVAEHEVNAQESQPFMPRGMLSRPFESQEQCDAIGYDRHGGTSYGIYQISSRQGTMDQFIDFLRQEIPAWAKRLEQAGPADTGSTQGAMPSAWQAIAREDSDLFADIQHRFITKTHYLPALENILQHTGIKEHLLSAPLREVIFSTAVQHGPTGAGNIFKQALENLDLDDSSDLAARLLDQIYTIRKTRFSSSSSRVQAAVTSRLNQEALLARHLLDSMIG